MFQITENKLLAQNKVVYKDEYGNSAEIKNEDGGFSAKLLFQDEEIKAKPMHIKLTDKGMDLKLNKSCSALDVQGGIKNFSCLVQRWFQIRTYMERLNTLKNIGDEKLKKDEIEHLKQYAELFPVIKAVGL